LTQSLCREETMESSRLFFYMGIALIISAIAFYILFEEPSSDYPINLIHLLFRH